MRVEARADNQPIRRGRESDDGGSHLINIKVKMD